MHKLRITPLDGKPYILRGYAALDRRMANRKAGEIVRAGKLDDVKVTSVDVLTVPTSR